MFPIKTKMHLHRSKDDNWYKAEELELSDEAASNFCYCCYEVELDIEIDEHGDTVATAINGVALTRPVKV